MFQLLYPTWLQSELGASTVPTLTCFTLVMVVPDLQVELFDTDR